MRLRRKKTPEREDADDRRREEREQEQIGRRYRSAESPMPTSSQVRHSWPGQRGRTAP